MGRLGKLVSEDGGVFDWSIGGVLFDFSFKVMKRILERSEIFVNWFLYEEKLRNLDRL